MSTEAIDLLKAIDGKLGQLIKLLAPAAGKTVASDRDLNGKYGDPTVSFMPRDWTGPSFKGRKMSDCPPELLDLLADTFEYFAEKADENNETTDKGKPVSGYKRADAARARGWAARIRSGRHVQTTPVNGSGSHRWAGDEDGL